MSRLLTPQLPSLTLPAMRLGGSALRLPKPKKAPEPDYPEGSLRSPQVVEAAKAGGDVGKLAEPNEPGWFLGAIEKVGQTLDKVDNEFRKLVYGPALFTDEELSKMRKDYFGQTILTGYDIADKMGISREDKVANAIAGFTIEMLGPMLLFGGPVAKSIGKVAGKGFVGIGPKVLRSGFRTIDRAAEAMTTLAKGRKGSSHIDDVLKMFGLEGIIDDTGKVAAEIGARVAKGNYRSARGYAKFAIGQGLAGSLKTQGPGLQAASRFFVEHGRRGLALLHVPFTQLALEVPQIGRQGLRWAMLRDLLHAFDVSDAAGVTAGKGALRAVNFAVDLGLERTAPMTQLVSKAFGFGERAEGPVRGALRKFEEDVWNLGQKFPVFGRQAPSRTKTAFRDLERAEAAQAHALRVLQFRNDINYNFGGAASHFAKRDPAEQAAFLTALQRRILELVPADATGPARIAEGEISQYAKYFADLPGNMAAASTPAAVKWHGDETLNALAETFITRYDNMWSAERARGFEIYYDPGYTLRTMSEEGRAKIKLHELVTGRAPTPARHWRPGMEFKQPSTMHRKSRIVALSNLDSTEGGRRLIARMKKVSDEGGSEWLWRDTLDGPWQMFGGRLDDATLRKSDPLLVRLQDHLRVQGELGIAVTKLDDLVATAEKAKLTMTPKAFAANAAKQKKWTATIKELKGTLADSPFAGLGDVKEHRLLTETMNELAMKNRMGYLFEPLESAPFLSDPFMAMGSRHHQHDVMMALGNLKEVVDEHGIVMSGLRIGDVEAMPLGAITQRVQASGAKNIVPGMEYRAVRLAEDNPLRRAMTEIPDVDDATKAVAAETVKVYPAPLAEAIEKAGTILASDDHVTALLAGAQKIMGVWKTSALLHPAWLMINIVGNLFNSVLGGMRIRDMPDIITASKLLAKQKKLHLLTGTMDIGGQVVGRRAFTERMLAGGPFTGSLTMAEMGDVMAKAAVRSMERGYGRKMAGKAKDAFLKTLGKFFQLNAATDAAVRGGMVMSLMRQGLDMETAMQRAMTALFDFGDLERLEKTAASILMPFYRWNRNNAPWQLFQAARRPAVYAAVPRAAMALEAAMVGNDRLPPELRPSWLRNELGVQVMGDKTGGTAILVNSALPSQEAFQLAASALGGPEAFEMLTGALNPFIGEAYAQATGRDVFTQRQLPPSDRGAVGYFKRIGKGLRQFREFQVVDRAIAKGESKSLVARFFLGGRAQKISAERGLQSRDIETQDVIRQGFADMRRQIRLGNPSGANEAAKRVADANRLRLELGLDAPRAFREFFGVPKKRKRVPEPLRTVLRSMTRAR